MIVLVLNEMVCMIASEYPGTHEDHEKGAMNSSALTYGKMCAGKGTVVDAHGPTGGMGRAIRLGFTELEESESSEKD